jgi:hypothetical protein
MMIKANEFLKILKTDTQQAVFRIGTIDPAYTGGRPAVIFDGETKVSQKKYPYLSSYSPTANDKVLLCRVAKSYIIIGKVI